MAFIPKQYQQNVLDTVRAFFQACHEHEKPSLAFSAVTEEFYGAALSYRPLPGFNSDMPYFCLRIPTGGGKTWLAAKSVDLINTYFLHREHSVVLWLVPSDPIREQTLKGLQSRGHPLHAALAEAGPVTILSLDEAKSVTRATLDTSTTVIVATRQAFQVEDGSIRKVYGSNGALMHHFDGLPSEIQNTLLKDENTTPYSLANVLRMRRPFIIVDEAHNSRTELSFETLSRFNPSAIMELTATPDMVKSPSNVLCSVSAAALKAEEMIKMPILLETEPNWQQCIANAIERRESLQAQAAIEMREGAKYFRPVMLIQAEPQNKTRETLHVYRIREELLSSHRIPEEEIIIATGEDKGLDVIAKKYPMGLADPKCPVKYIITQKALAEGWDCPFAYVLTSVASLSSSTAVEQLLGRILRQPNATRFESELLNQSYAFVASSDFSATAGMLRDQLVTGAGFERRDVQDFVKAARSEQGKLDIEIPKETEPVEVTLPSGVVLGSIPKSLSDKVSWNKNVNRLVISSPLSPDEVTTVKNLTSDTKSQELIEQAAKASLDKVVFIQFPAELGERMRIPQFTLLAYGKRTVFDDPELLNYDFDLSKEIALPGDEAIETLDRAYSAAELGTIDISKDGVIESAFLQQVQHTLDLVYTPENWDIIKLAAWLCANIQDHSITHQHKMAFVLSWVQALQDIHQFSLARINQQKFIIRNAIERHIQKQKVQAAKQAFQCTLFGAAARESVSVDKEYVFEFDKYNYAPPSFYDGRWGHHVFKKHFYRQIGDFDSKEEFDCACFLDKEAVKGNIKFWVRNVSKGSSSFFLQKASSKFYPDFVCILPDDSILVVEYKGKDRWDTEKVKEDRAIGALWAELSNGSCKFVMLHSREWGRITSCFI